MWDIINNWKEILPEVDVVISNAILFGLEVKAQSMETQQLRRTFFEKHQRPHQHLEEDQEDTPHDQTQAQDPATKSHENMYNYLLIS
jgi:hypothetical protein